MSDRRPPHALLEAVRVRKGRAIGPEWRFQCPHPGRHRHGDSDPSARYNPDKAVWRCDVCDTGGGWVALCRLLGVEIPTPTVGRPQIVARYVYRSEKGEAQRRKLRWEPGFSGRTKSFTWEKPGDNGRWTQCTGDGNPKILYGSERLPKARERGRTVLIVEGEKDCDTATRLDLVAVCNPEGASASGKWPRRYSEQLRGLRVVVIADKDDPGRAHARGAAKGLEGISSDVRYLELPGDSVKDLTDWVNHQQLSGSNKASIRKAFVGLCKTAVSVGELVTVAPGDTLPTQGDQEALLASLRSSDTLESIKPVVQQLAMLAAHLDLLDLSLLREKTISALKGKVSSPATLVDVAFKEAASTQAPPNDSIASGRMITFTDPAPWPEPVDGQTLLDDLEALFRRFVALSPGASTALALWVLHTYTYQQSQISPLLLISSPEKRCGKTTLLTVLTQLVHRPLSASNITPAALFRTIEAYGPTLLIDEADTFLQQSDELRGVLNSGHSRSTAFVVRTVGEDHEPRQFSTWAPKAVALIGRPPSTLEDRSVAIAMRRKMPEESVERLRLDRLDLFHSFRSRIVRWTTDHSTRLQGQDPQVPTSLHDRAADNWRPLLAIAEAVGPPWPECAREAAEQLSSQSSQEDNSPGVMLLTDLNEIFERRGVSVVASHDLVADLLERDDRPWPEWRRGHPLTAVQLARLLKPFGIRPQQLRCGAVKIRGYARSDFTEAFSRYVPPIESVHPVQTATTAAPGHFSTRYNFPHKQGPEQHLSTSVINDVPGVPGRNPVQMPISRSDQEVIEL